MLYKRLQYKHIGLFAMGIFIFINIHVYIIFFLYKFLLNLYFSLYFSSSFFMIFCPSDFMSKLLIFFLSSYNRHFSCKLNKVQRSLYKFRRISHNYCRFKNPFSIIKDKDISRILRKFVERGVVEVQGSGSGSSPHLLLVLTVGLFVGLLVEDPFTVQILVQDWRGEGCHTQASYHNESVHL